MSQMVFRARKGKRQVHLNVTSLIDVLFLLLIFFMLTGTFKRAGELELQLPDSSTSTPEGEQPATPVELIATEEGILVLDGEAVPLAALKGRLGELHAADATRRILLKAEAGVAHGEVVRLLDIVRDAGFPGVGIGTQMEPLDGAPADRR